MIQANEFRVGNWLNVLHPHTKEWKYEKVKSETILNFEKHSDHTLIKENFKTIPLTEEILLKCEFDEWDMDGNREFQMCNNSLNLGIIEWNNTDRCVNLIFEGTQCGQNIYYIHQLQNLIYSLTGEELEINL